MNTDAYWNEAVSVALDEAGVTATNEQIAAIAGSIQVSHENIGMAYPTPEHPAIREASDLKRELEKERAKVVCPDCKGRGSITTTWGSSGRSSTGRCDTCNGEGYKLP